MATLYTKYCEELNQNLNRIVRNLILLNIAAFPILK
jgi:hypothetical protein